MKRASRRAAYFHYTLLSDYGCCLKLLKPWLPCHKDCTSNCEWKQIFSPLGYLEIVSAKEIKKMATYLQWSLRCLPLPWDRTSWCVLGIWRSAWCLEQFQEMVFLCRHKHCFICHLSLLLFSNPFTIFISVFQVTLMTFFVYHSFVYFKHFFGFLLVP